MKLYKAFALLLWAAAGRAMMSPTYYDDLMAEEAEIASREPEQKQQEEHKLQAPEEKPRTIRTVSEELLPPNVLRSLIDEYTGEQFVQSKVIPLKESVFCASFNADGTLIVAGDRYSNIYIIDAHTGKLQHSIIRNLSYPLTSTFFSPDNLRILTRGHNGKVEVLSAVTGKHLHRFELSSQSVTFNHAGTLIAIATNYGIYLYDATTYKLFRKLGYTSYSVSFSQDDSQLIAAGPGVARIFNMKTGESSSPFPPGYGNMATSAALSPDTQSIVTLQNKTASVWNAADGHHKYTVKGLTRSVHYNHDGTLLVTTGWTSDIGIWQASDGTLLQKLEGHTSEVMSADFSADGTKMVSAGYDGTVRIWDKIQLASPQQAKKVIRIKKQEEKQEAEAEILEALVSPAEQQALLQQFQKMQARLNLRQLLSQKELKEIDNHIHFLATIKNIMRGELTTRAKRLHELNQMIEQKAARAGEQGL